MPKREAIMKITLTRTLLVSAAVIAISVSSTGYTAEIGVSGTVTYVTVSQDLTKLADGRSILRLHDKGIVRTEDAKSPINGAMEDCFDTVILDKDGNPADGAGYCDTFDKDGDGYWFSWVGTATGTDWVVYHGNGKFDGVTGSGSGTTDFMLDDRFAITFKGKLTMK
jgi:hypothetical protein